MVAKPWPPNPFNRSTEAGSSGLSGDTRSRRCGAILHVESSETMLSPRVKGYEDLFKSTLRGAIHRCGYLVRSEGY